MNIDVDEAVDKKILMLSSTYVLSQWVPSLINKVCLGTIIVEGTHHQFSHHITAAGSNYGCATGRFNAVMFEAGNAHTISTCNESEVPLWFEKFLAFISVI